MKNKTNSGIKKTKYFASNHKSFNEKGLEDCIYTAEQKRDDFFEENKENIAKIDREDIKLINGNAGNSYIQYIMVVIQVTYYTK